jgi:cbb3-type cytochrome oxidase subunit 1
MTVSPRVNPKKLRPYDTPPKRRRSLIPSAPDNAAIGFLVAAALWFALAAGIGLLAVALRLVTFEFSIPLPVFDLSVSFDVRRVDAAFVNATVYGWLTNAGFAAVAFMTPRLTGRRLAGEAGMVFALLVWNATLLAAIAALYVFDLGPNQPLTAFPWLLQGGLAFGALIVTASFLATAATSLRSGYISLWFIGVALLGLIGLLGLGATIGLVDWFVHFDPLVLALASAFLERAIPAMWLLGMTYAVLHYVVPRASGQPLASGGLAVMTWLTWLVLAPASAVAVLADPSIPFFLTTAGSVATMLLVVPAALAAGNLAMTMQGRWTLLFGTGAAALAITAATVLLASCMVAAIGSLTSVEAFLRGSEWAWGAFTWTTFGAFSLAALALTDHAFPRMLKRAWSGGLLGVAQLWLVFVGATVAGIALMGSGIAHGAFMAQAASPDDISAGLLGYRAIAFLGMGMVALGAVALLADLFVIYTVARPVAYAAPSGAAAPAAVSH